eukprot:5623244-Pyramimonas_sp.AAC.1
MGVVDARPEGGGAGRKHDDDFFSGEDVGGDDLDENVRRRAHVGGARAMKGERPALLQRRGV